jgi:hypothetical protein
VQSETWCSLPFGEVEQRLLPPILGGGRAKGQERGRTLGRLVPQEGMELDMVVSGSAEKRRRNGDDRNDRICKRSAVMRVCTAGEGSGSDLGAGVGLAMRQVAVKWNTTDEWRALE